MNIAALTWSKFQVTLYSDICIDLMNANHHGLTQIKLYNLFNHVFFILLVFKKNVIKFVPLQNGTSCNLLE